MSGEPDMNPGDLVFFFYVSCMAVFKKKNQDGSMAQLIGKTYTILFLIESMTLLASASS